MQTLCWSILWRIYGITHFKISYIWIGIQENIMMCALFWEDKKMEELFLDESLDFWMLWLTNP
jgi:hypothetical protein